MKLSETITALFVGAMYYWLIDNQLGADTCLRAALTIIEI
jgi:hypothetical protein